MLMILVRWILRKTLNRLSQYHLGEQLDLCNFGALPPIQHFSEVNCCSAWWVEFTTAQKEHGMTTRTDDGCFFLIQCSKVVVRVISRIACAQRNVLLKNEQDWTEGKTTTSHCLRTQSVRTTTLPFKQSDFAGRSYQTHSFSSWQCRRLRAREKNFHSAKCVKHKSNYEGTFRPSNIQTRGNLHTFFDLRRCQTVQAKHPMKSIKSRNFLDFSTPSACAGQSSHQLLSWWQLSTERTHRYPPTPQRSTQTQPICQKRSNCWVSATLRSRSTCHSQSTSWWARH